MMVYVVTNLLQITYCCWVLGTSSLMGQMQHIFGGRWQFMLLTFFVVFFLF